MFITGSLATLVYGILIAVGGLMGFLFSKSMASLIAGVSCGLLLVLSSVLLGRSVVFGQWLAFFVTFLIVVMFTKNLVVSIQEDKSAIVRCLVVLILSLVELYYLFRN